MASVSPTRDGFTGAGRWNDGEIFSFEGDEPLDDLERWALEIVSSKFSEVA